MKKPWTAVAEPYPKGFAASIARAAASAIGWRRVASDVSVSGGGRIGEAKNPGPRGSRAPRRGSLESKPIQGAGTLLLGERCWEKFLCWCDGYLVESDPLELFLRVPLFLAHAIRRYGDREYQAGGALLYYRHLVLVAQRKVPQLKAMVHICWELASRGELSEPTEHRTPMPLPLLEAMVMLAWHMRWYRWSAIAVACFSVFLASGKFWQPPDEVFFCLMIFWMITTKQHIWCCGRVRLASGSRHEFNM